MTQSTCVRLFFPFPYFMPPPTCTCNPSPSPTPPPLSKNLVTFTFYLILLLSIFGYIFKSQFGWFSELFKKSRNLRMMVKMVAVQNKIIMQFLHHVTSPSFCEAQRKDIWMYCIPTTSLSALEVTGVVPPSPPRLRK